jgi:transcriptional regulator with XRE-family HTH domain
MTAGYTCPYPERMITQAPPLTYHALLDRQRQTHGLSYQQLAERAWTTASYVHRLCRGDARPGYAIVLRLAIAMALTLEETDEMLRVASYPPLLEITVPANGKNGPEVTAGQGT